MFKTIAKNFARGVLSIMGWEVQDVDYYKQRIPDAQVILLFSHSTYWDFVLFMLYSMACPGMLDDLCTVMKPGPFKWFGWILRRIGFIPATKNQGFVQKVSEELRNRGRFRLVLSPKGTRANVEWRSGYYWIARETGAHLQVVGLDYSQGRLRVLPSRPFVEDRLLLEQQLKQDMKQITPLHPELELHPDVLPKYIAVTDGNIFLALYHVAIFVLALAAFQLV